MTPLSTRKDILDLAQTEKDTLIRAFRGIQDLRPEDPDSFFAIAAFHGQPFRGPGYSNKEWWGGYCHHGNVLFPVWHRAYLLRLEKALRKIPGCQALCLPYWNQMKSQNGRVIPDIFLQKKYSLDGEVVDNPLYSYKLQRGFYDNLARTAGDKDVDYSKNRGYETVRYPYSGLVGAKDREKTRLHNQNIAAKGNATTARMLDDNVKGWLEGRIGTPGFLPDGPEDISGMRERYMRSLSAPNYTVFSNTTSAAKWNDDHSGPHREPRHSSEALVFSIETPHNGMHLAIGGYDMPEKPTNTDANGDMGENDTASFDPIFYFHHVFIDMVFWSWQELHNSTKSLDFIPEYPGTNSVDSQGPTPGTLAGSWLTIDTPLDPFKWDDGKPLVSRDIVNIHALGYTYDLTLKPEVGKTPVAAPILRVSGINRTSIAGSFVISIWATPKPQPPRRQHPPPLPAAERKGEELEDQTPKPQPKEEILIGFEPVFSRWYVPGCANCSNSLLVTTHIPLAGWSLHDARKLNLVVKLAAKDGQTGKKGIQGPDKEGQYVGSLKRVQLDIEWGVDLLKRGRSRRGSKL